MEANGRSIDLIDKAVVMLMNEDLALTAAPGEEVWVYCTSAQREADTVMVSLDYSPSNDGDNRSHFTVRIEDFKA